MNYQNGKIYKIVSNQSEEVYIGSTAQVLLCQRFGQHKTQYKRYLNGNTKKQISSFNVLQYNDAYIVLIEAYPCHTKEELRCREQYHMDLHKDITINKQRAIGLGTELQKDKIKEYYELNKDKIKAQKKEYRKLNKIKIQVQHKEYYELNKDKVSAKCKEYYELNKDKLQAQHKEYYEVNKDRT